MKARKRIALQRKGESDGGDQGRVRREQRKAGGRKNQGAEDGGHVMFQGKIVHKSVIPCSDVYPPRDIIHTLVEEEILRLAQGSAKGLDSTRVFPHTGTGRRGEGKPM